MTTEKPCSTCGETKALEAFPIDKRNNDGRAYVCRTCTNAAIRARRHANIEETRRKNREWADPEKDRARAARYRQEHPEEYRESVARALNRYQRETEAVATRRGEPWTDDDDKLLLKKNTMTLRQKAEALGKTYGQANGRLNRLRKNKQQRKKPKKA